jgi:hypothetical protein
MAEGRVVGEFVSYEDMHLFAHLLHNLFTHSLDQQIRSVPRLKPVLRVIQGGRAHA